MRVMGLVVVVVMMGCSFPAPVPLSPDAGPSIPATARRITFTIEGAQLGAPLVDFPVYLDVTQPDFSTRLDPAQISFRRRLETTVEDLPYELQSYDAAAGRLRAWILLPQLSNVANNVFELQYGAAEIASLPDSPEVWRDHFKAVFHLEGASAPILDSRLQYPATPGNLQTNASIAAQLGNGVDFDGNNNSYIAFTNPIVGTIPSTISAWISQKSATGKDALVALGAGATSQARGLYSYFNNGQVALTLYNDEWRSTAIDLQNKGWKLIHWVYSARVSRIFLDGQLVRGPYTHGVTANTQGADGWLGNSKTPLFDTNSGLRGTLDEVRISDVARSDAWIAAEFINQSNPAGFAAASSPQPLP